MKLASFFCWTFFPLGIIVFIYKSSRSIYFEEEKETPFSDNFLLDLFLWLDVQSTLFPQRFYRNWKRIKSLTRQKYPVSNSLNISEDCFGRDKRTFKLISSSALMCQIQLLFQYCLERTIILIYCSFCFLFVIFNFIK